MNRGLPWLPCLERFGPNMAREDLKVAQGALHSCCDACLRGDYAWIGPVLHNCGASEPASDADPRQNARETTRNDEKRKEATGRQEGPNDLGWAAGHAICRKGTSLQRLTCELAATQNPCTCDWSLIGCLLLLARCRLRLCRAAVAPPPRWRHSWAPCSRRGNRGGKTAHVRED